VDPLSDVLALLKPQKYLAGGFDTAGPWSVRFPDHEGIKCYSVVAGSAWLSVDAVPEPVRLHTGDCFLLPSGGPFRLCSDLALAPIGVDRFLTLRGDGITTWNGGGDCCIVGGHFVFSGEAAAMLLGMLSPIVHLREESAKAALRWSVDRITHELRERRPGSALVVQHLAQMMLVEALRVHLTESRGAVGWLFALADRQVGAAITAMHEQPGHRWTLQALAERAAMSRSTFALRFKETVGMAPMEYLARWRMLLAEDRLASSSDSVSLVALSLGYDSESAFSTAFKRITGRSPRRRQRAASRLTSRLGGSPK
jgi:AraC-like DNA-binding protein